jgi:flagellar assembly protein FliH
MTPSRPRNGSRQPQFLARNAGQGQVQRATFRPASGQPARPRAPIAQPLPQQQPEDPEDAAAAQVQEVIAAAVAEAEQRIHAEVGARLGAAVEALRTTSDRLAGEARADALEVGFLIARRILESELAASPEPLVSLVRSTIRRLGEARKMVVRLSPPDAEAVSAVLAARGAAAVSAVTTAQIEVVADGALERGDCMVEGDVGSVDGRVATRIEELRRALADEHLEEGT